MSINLKIVITILIILYLLIMFKNIKKGKLQLSFSIFSILIGFFMIIALMIPSLLENLTRLLGFEVTSNMLFLVAIFITFYLIFRLMIILSAEYKKNVKLIQEISMLKARIEILEKNRED